MILFPKPQAPISPCALACLSLLAGCGSTSGGGGSPDLAMPPTIDDVCTTQAAGVCAKLDSCRKNGVQLRYGDMGTCLARVKLGCAAALGAPGTGNSPANTKLCNDAIASATCADYLSGNIDACQPKTGQLAAGAKCSYPAQCASGYCSIPLGSGCGTCANPPAVGDSCTHSGQCGRAMYCTAKAGQMGTCAAFGGQGVACTSSVDCYAGLACVGAVNGASGTCQPAMATAMSACDYKLGPNCDFYQGLFCSTPPMSSAGTCVAIGTATDGQPCGVTFPMAGSMDVLCAAGGVCYGAMKGMAGACKGPAADGAACDTVSGPPCLTPARCVAAMAGGTAGTCKLADPPSCM